MRMSDLESEQRAREYFHGLTVLPGAWIVIRVDGRSFSRFTAEHFKKPFDAIFSRHMTDTAAALLKELQGIYAYTESDEISVLLPRSFALFGRNVEKLVSVSAGVASAAFTSVARVAAHFDSRIWVGTCDDDVLDYFSWRQADAARCGLNGWAYWALRRDGATAKEATAQLLSLGTSAKNELLFARGVNFNDVPAWQRRGTGLVWETFGKVGVNPVTGEAVTATRRRHAVLDDLPIKQEYRDWLRRLINAA